jgi:hypothetical protein
LKYIHGQKRAYVKRRVEGRIRSKGEGGKGVRSGEERRYFAVTFG